MINTALISVKYAATSQKQPHLAEGYDSAIILLTKKETNKWIYKKCPFKISLLIKITFFFFLPINRFFLQYILPSKTILNQIKQEQLSSFFPWLCVS